MPWDRFSSLDSLCWQTDAGATPGGAGDGSPDDPPPGDASDPPGDAPDAKNKPKTTLTGITPEQQAEIDALVEREKQKAARAAAKDAATAERQRLEAEAKTKEAQDQGNWKALYETQQAETERLAADLKARDRLDLARVVAEKYKLPAGLVDRLKGDTEADLDADAKELAKQVGARDAPPTDGGRGAPGSRTTGSSPNGPAVTTPPETPKDPYYMQNGEPRVRWPDKV